MKPAAIQLLWEVFYKEVMDNCIYVTHQLFELSRENEAMAKFMVTGFLFNSVVLSLSHLEDRDDGEAGDGGSDLVH